MGRGPSEGHRLLDPSGEPEGNNLNMGPFTRDLLPDWSEEWVTCERARFHELRLHALETLCERLSAAGRHGEAVEAGVVAVAAEPLRESSQRSLIRAYQAEGNQGQAIRQYRRLQQLLRDELDVEPSFHLDENNGRSPDSPRGTA